MTKNNIPTAVKDGHAVDGKESNLSLILGLHQYVSLFDGKLGYEIIIENSSEKLEIIGDIVNDMGYKTEILFWNKILSFDYVKDYWNHILYLCRMGMDIIAKNNKEGIQTPDEIACNIFLAYGNALTRVGRVFAAIDSYYLAIKFANKMEKTNNNKELLLRTNGLLYNRLWDVKSIVPLCDYEVFFKADSRPRIRVLFPYIFHCLLSDVIDLAKKAEQMQNDQFMQLNRADYVKNNIDRAFIDRMESYFKEALQDSPPKWPYELRSDKEKRYRQFVMENHLFLSVFNLLPTIEGRPMMDDLYCNFEGEKKEVHIALFDDIKQAFAYSRLQFFTYYERLSSLKEGYREHFSMILTHDGGSNIAFHESILMQELIESYLRLYSILDKIGNLASSAFGLNIGTGKKDKRKPTIRNVALEINQYDNPFLQQLKAIFMEIDPEYEEKAEKIPYYRLTPKAERMDFVRNHLMHNAVEFVLEEEKIKNSNERIQYISPIEFEDLTSKLLDIVKEAIMTIWAAVSYKTMSAEKKEGILSFQESTHRLLRDYSQKSYEIKKDSGEIE